ncbi:MAG: hypothetical protein KAS32_17105 [Candidatus Peribacteraceae bacterium]|nr:hypothetical protein [Candidatus Peribacteraceae bacterium]
MTERIFRWLPVLISVLVAITTVAVAWGSLGARVSGNESDIESNKERISEVEQAVPQIQTDLEWIREALVRIENQ